MGLKKLQWSGGIDWKRTREESRSGRELNAAANDGFLALKSQPAHQFGERLLIDP